MEKEKIHEKSKKELYRKMSGDDPFRYQGVFCPMCRDWIVTPKEHIDLDSLVVENKVFEHYEAFHTAEEIEKFIGGKK